MAEKHRHHDETTFIIGGREFHAPPMVFLALLRAKDSIKAFANQGNDKWEQLDAALGIITAALSVTNNPPSLTELQLLLHWEESDALCTAVIDLLTKSGFIKGNATAASQAEATSISMESSPSLPPMGFAAETGTE